MAMLNNQRVYIMIPPKTTMYTKVAKQNHGGGKKRKKSTKFGDSKIGILVPITSSCFSQGVFHESLPTKKWYLLYIQTCRKWGVWPSINSIASAQLPGCELHHTEPHPNSTILVLKPSETQWVFGDHQFFETPPNTVCKHMLDGFQWGSLMADMDGLIKQRYIGVPWLWKPP